MYYDVRVCVEQCKQNSLHPELAVFITFFSPILYCVKATAFSPLLLPVLVVVGANALVFSTFKGCSGDRRACGKSSILYVSVSTEFHYVVYFATMLQASITQVPLAWPLPRNIVVIGSLRPALTTAMMKSAPLNISPLNGVFTAFVLNHPFPLIIQRPERKTV